MNINQLSPEEFRLKIAGLIDPLKKMDTFEKKALNDEAIKFVSILPEVFSDNLDRLTLWDRIGNGLLVSVSKAGNNLELFLNYCLEYIKADSGKVASNEKLINFFNFIDTRPVEWKEQFLKIVEKHHYLIIVKARMIWNKDKKINKEIQINE